MSGRGKAVFTICAGSGFAACAIFMLARCGATAVGAWLLALGLAAGLWGIGRVFEFDGWAVAVVTLATALCLIYASYTGLNERNYDGPDHFWYASTIARTGRLPAPNACTVCWHSPLYYSIGALAIRVADAFHVATPECAMQYLSLLFFLAFLTFGALTLREITRDRVARNAGIAVLAFWPTSILNSIRVHDDALFAALAAGVVYFTVRLQYRRRQGDAVLAVLFAAAAAFTKANAYAWAALPLLMLGWQCISERFRWSRVRNLAFGSAGVALAAFGATGWRTIGKGSACHRTIGIVCDYGTEHFVGNRLVNYVTFDVGFFLKEPFMLNDPYDRAKDYVLNNLLKTSLLNAVPLGPKFEDRFSAALATGFSVLLLGLALFMLLGVLLVISRVHWGRGAVLGLATLLALGQLLALRSLAPLSMHADFRYVYPILIPAAALYSKLLEPGRWRPILRRIGLGLACIWVVCSVAFFRPNAERRHQPDTPPSVAVQSSLADVSQIRETGSPIDTRAKRFGAHQFLEFRLPERREISRLDLSLDADDQYRVLVISPTFSWTFWFGPQLSTSGLVRYVKSSPFPMRDVTTIQIHPHQSDANYALGHLRIK